MPKSCWSRFLETKKEIWKLLRMKRIIIERWYPRIFLIEIYQKIRQCRQICHHKQYPIIVLFPYSHHLTFWKCINTVRRNCMFIISSWELKFLYVRTVCKWLSTVSFKQGNGKLNQFYTLPLSIWKKSFISKTNKVFTLAHWLFYKWP